MTSPHENCTAHSGLDDRMKLLIWLVGALLLTNIGSGAMVYSIKSDLSINQAIVSGDVKALTERIGKLEKRMDAHEYGGR